MLKIILIYFKCVTHSSEPFVWDIWMLSPATSTPDSSTSSSWNKNKNNKKFHTFTYYPTEFWFFLTVHRLLKIELVTYRIRTIQISSCSSLALILKGCYKFCKSPDVTVLLNLKPQVFSVFFLSPIPKKVHKLHIALPNHYLLELLGSNKTRLDQSHSRFQWYRSELSAFWWGAAATHSDTCREREIQCTSCTAFYHLCNLSVIISYAHNQFKRCN